MPQNMQDVDAPDELPSYVEDTIRNHEDDSEVLSAISEFASDLLGDEAGEAPSPAEIRAEVDGEVQDIDSSRDGTLVKKKVTCGDETCKCITSGEKHGPYWYRVTRNGDELSWEYLGKDVPAEA